MVDYYGLTPQEERQENIKKFQNGDECRFIVGTTQTGGYGITLMDMTSKKDYNQKIEHTELDNPNL